LAIYFWALFWSLLWAAQNAQPHGILLLIACFSKLEVNSTEHFLT